MAGRPVRAEPVTVTVARRVASGREADFEEFSDALTHAASAFPGFLGAGMLRPGHVGEPWHVVFRFARRGARARHERPPRLRARDLVRPAVAEAPAPPRWKMFVVSIAGIYVLQLVLDLAVTPLTLPLPLRVGLVAVAVTALMTWLVMPRLALLLQDWLYWPPRRA